LGVILLDFSLGIFSKDEKSEKIFFYVPLTTSNNHKEYNVLYI